MTADMEYCMTKDSQLKNQSKDDSMNQLFGQYRVQFGNNAPPIATDTAQQSAKALTWGGISANRAEHGWISFRILHHEDAGTPGCRVP
jgi:hypothetical protein